MKRAVFFLLFAIACAARTEIYPGDAGIDVDDAATTCTQNSCSSDDHSCACATGHYCLRRGAECVDPSMPCPVCH